MNREIQMINEVINEINEVVNCLQGGNEQKGYKLISKLSTKIEEIISFNIAENIDVNNLNNILNEIVNALFDGDLVLVGDMFLYEVLPIMEELKETNMEACNS